MFNTHIFSVDWNEAKQLRQSSLFFDDRNEFNPSVKFFRIMSTQNLGSGNDKLNTYKSLNKTKRYIFSPRPRATVLCKNFILT